MTADLSSPPPNDSLPQPTVTTPAPTRTTGKADDGDPTAGMTLAEKVGQLFMVGAAVNDPPAATYRAVSTYHVGSVILVGRSTQGVTATRKTSDALQAARADGAPDLFVAVDQEGGNIQVLRGPGFSTMPAALEQGTWAVSRLRSQAETWGAQLHDAGVNLNLSPVMDVVPSPADNASNAPIGYWHRQFGYTPAVVVPHANAFGDGMRAAGVGDTVKHFPGLGRVTGNTDFTSGVTDTVTKPGDPYVETFAAGMKNHPTAVMTSTAIYANIDPKNPGAFSSKVVTGLLRDDMGWDGLVITDDVSAAKQVSAWTPAERAVKSIAAGNDIVLAGNPDQIPAMTAAVVAHAKTDPEFAQQVDASARRVLDAKASVLG
ncbi:beta-N-acetylhexosaminidase [Luteimicrobium subarcticum]|uniref:beta-N-acetylhexosaminidase n=2 Tax=Luteimicrobium subarcticum TaxID=620910 RepID=A0A2M8WQW0_9MICO|nr:beta-N-acetylhexosaminidase [Luteimicrobium subarcticum]